MKYFNLEDVKFARVKENKGTKLNDKHLLMVVGISKVTASLFVFGDCYGNTYSTNDCHHLSGGSWEFLDEKMNVIDTQKLLDKLSQDPKEEFDSEPFDLEKALAGHPVWTVGGKEVKNLTYFKDADPKIEKLPVFCLIDREVEKYTKNGSYHVYINKGCHYDLRMKVKKKEKKEGWICIEKEQFQCSYGRSKKTSRLFTTKEAAIEHAKHGLHLVDFIAHKIEYFE